MSLLGLSCPYWVCPAHGVKLRGALAYSWQQLAVKVKHDSCRRMPEAILTQRRQEPRWQEDDLNDEAAQVTGSRRGAALAFRRCG